MEASRKQMLVKMAKELEKEKEKKFISGVVEGFYGRPWNLDQRRHLFGRLRELGLNTYMYAPKNDALHRKLWRKLYDETEKENLKSLINDASSNGISFVYAISPGLDIIFSCPKDVQFLKDKLKQVADLGCKSFALLFDDIEPELSLPDKQDFDSFSDAQISITNSIYEYLGKTDLFLFCPTEYCSSRAKPSVEKSEYLKTLGNKLNINIDVLWTGPKVVPRNITVSSIQLVSKVLKRKPVIWDNSHANDYDKRRIFLGPYDGRPTELYQHVNGVFSNPNCEYESNFIAFYTLSHWLQCCISKGRNFTPNKDTENPGKELNICDGNNTLSDDIEMEANDSDSFESRICDLKDSESMQVVVEEHSEANKEKADLDDSGRPVTIQAEKLGQIDYDAKEALDIAVSEWVEEFHKVRLLGKRNHDFYKSPAKLAVAECMSSLYETTSDYEDEALEVGIKIINDVCIDKNDEDTCCPYHSSGKGKTEMDGKKDSNSNVTKEDLFLMIDLFFLPYEHGELAKHLVSEFKWIQTNAPPVQSNKEQYKIVEEWKGRVADFRKLCQDIADMFHHISNAPNKPLVQELYPYILDVKDVAMLLEAYVKWLDSKSRKCKAGTNQIPEDPEPWLCKGGIVEQLERLLPTDMATELPFSTASSLESFNVFTIRPYLETDKANIYKVCSQSYQDDIKKNDLFPNYPDLPGDRFVGVYLQNTNDKALFVLEDDDGICGYCVGAFDSKQFIDECNRWFVNVSAKYDSSLLGLSEHEQLLIKAINKSEEMLSDDFYQKYPAQIAIAFLSRAQMTRIGKRLLCCVISLIKSTQIKGVHCHVSPCNDSIRELLKDFGFVSLQKPTSNSILAMDLF